MKINLSEIEKKITPIKSNERYNLYDIPLDRHTVSLTVLRPGKETRGHAHDGIEEVYIFVDGDGFMENGEEKFAVSKGDIVTIGANAFHKVFNRGKKDLKFVTVFEKYERE